MKNPHLGDTILWEGKLAKVIGLADRPTVIIEMIADKLCPHCKGSLGKEQFSVVISSPLFQGGAKPVQTLDDEPTTKVF